MKVQLHPKWLFVLGSTLLVVMLREHRLLMTVYVGLFLLGTLLYVFWLPFRVAAAERRFGRESLKLLATQDFEGLDQLVRTQWLIRKLGRRHLLPNALALAASAAGRHDAARALFLRALRDAPPEERTQIELNLGTEELALAHWVAAEGRFRAVLRRRPDLGLAQSGLAKALLERGEQLDEAAELLGDALTMADPAEAAILQICLAEALLRSGEPSWADALEEARHAGADARDIARIEEMHAAQSG